MQKPLIFLLHPPFCYSYRMPKHSYNTGEYHIRKTKGTTPENQLESEYSDDNSRNDCWEYSFVRNNSKKLFEFQKVQYVGNGDAEKLILSFRLSLTKCQ